MDFKKYQLIFRYGVFIYLLSALFSLSAVAGQSEIQGIEKDKQLFSQAVKYSTLQQWDQAEPIYRDLILRNKTWPEPANNLAILLLKTQRIDEAKAMFEQAVSSSAAFRISQKNRSQLYNYLATQAYAKALGENSENSSGETSAIVMPEFELIKNISQQIKTIEVEKIVIKKEPIEPSPEFERPQETQADISMDIKQQVKLWAKAWSKSDFDSYIKFYSTDFLPSDASKNYTQWRHTRRTRIRYTKGVQVEIDKLRTFIEPQGDYALVEFIQNYHSNSYSDKVLKQLYMHIQQGEWLILSERTIKVF